MELSIKGEFGDVMTALKEWITENNKQFKYKRYTIGKNNFCVSLVDIHFYSQKDIRLIFHCGEKEGIVYFTQIAELSTLNNNEVKISFDVTREGMKTANKDDTRRYLKMIALHARYSRKKFIANLYKQVGNAVTVNVVEAIGDI